MTVRPDADLGRAWDDFIWAEENRHKTRNLGNRHLINAMRLYLSEVAGVPLHSGDVGGADVRTEKPAVQYQAKAYSGTPSEQATFAEWESPWIKRLLAVLRSGNQIVTEAIQKNLEAFCLVPGVGDVGNNDPAPTDPPGTPPGLVQRAEDTHDAAQQAIKRHRAARAGNPGSRKRA